MRASIIGLAACVLPLWAGLAASQQQETPSNTAAQPQERAARAAQQAGEGKLPSAEQLLRVPVTGLQVGGAPKPPQIDNPYAKDKAALEQGAKLFDAMNCSGCHAPLGGGGMGPPLSDSSWIYGSAPADVFLSIQQGRPNGMPSWGHIGEEAIWMLVAYVRNLDKQVTSMAAEGGRGEHSTATGQSGSAAGEQSAPRNR